MDLWTHYWLENICDVSRTMCVFVFVHVGAADSVMEVYTDNFETNGYQFKGKAVV